MHSRSAPLLAALALAACSNTSSVRELDALQADLSRTYCASCFARSYSSEEECRAGEPGGLSEAALTCREERAARNPEVDLWVRCLIEATRQAQTCFANAGCAIDECIDAYSAASDACDPDNQFRFAGCPEE